MNYKNKTPEIKKENSYKKEQNTLSKLKQLNIPSVTNVHKLYRKKLTTEKSWRLKHSAYYLLAGLVYTFAGLCYLSPIKEALNGEYLGGWMLCLGSIFMTTAAYLDFNFVKEQVEKNIEIYYNYKKHYIHLDGVAELPDYYGFYSTGLGINYTLSVLGSFLFILGGICFTPQINMTNVAYRFIDIGNLLVFLSGVWKVFRILCTEEHEQEIALDIGETKMSLMKETNFAITKDNFISSHDTNLFLLSETMYGACGLLYLIATYYMPKIKVSGLVYLTFMYIFAGVCLVIAALVVINEYFFNDYISSFDEEDHKYKRLD